MSGRIYSQLIRYHIRGDIKTREVTTATIRSRLQTLATSLSDIEDTLKNRGNIVHL